MSHRFSSSLMDQRKLRKYSLECPDRNDPLPFYKGENSTACLHMAWHGLVTFSDRERPGVQSKTDWFNNFHLHWKLDPCLTGKECHKLAKIVDPHLRVIFANTEFYEQGGVAVSHFLPIANHHVHIVGRICSTFHARIKVYEPLEFIDMMYSSYRSFTEDFEFCDKPFEILEKRIMADLKWMKKNHVYVPNYADYCRKSIADEIRESQESEDMFAITCYYDELEWSEINPFGGMLTNYGGSCPNKAASLAEVREWYQAQWWGSEPKKEFTKTQLIPAEVLANVSEQTVESADLVPDWFHSMARETKPVQRREISLQPSSRGRGLHGLLSCITSLFAR